MVRRRDVVATIALGGLLAGPGCVDSGGSGDATPEPTTEPSTHTPTHAPTQSPTPTDASTVTPYDDGYVSPTDSPDHVPAFVCDDPEFERMGFWADDVVWGTVTDDGWPVFTLRASDRSVALGETIAITLRNVSDETQLTGNFHQFNLSLRTEEGWTEVRGWADGQPKPITDEALEIEPGETHVWEFRLTDGGVVGVSYPNYRDSLAVCPSLQPGRYRFAFGSLVGYDVGLAVAFDVTES